MVEQAKREALRLEPVARIVLSAIALTLAIALVAVLLNAGTPVLVLLAGGLLLTGVPAVWLLVRLARAQELEAERAKLAGMKDGPAVAQPDAEQPKALKY